MNLFITDKLHFVGENGRRFNKERDDLFKFFIQNNLIKWSARESKLHTGKLSDGCLICGRGDWLCVHINSSCDADCYFCPDDQNGATAFPASGLFTFRNPNQLAKTVNDFAMKGVGFSGGEPFQMFDRLIDYTSCLRKECDPSLYLWVYTNGIHVDREKLQILSEIGVDEIRFNIAAGRNYKLDKVKIAKEIMKKVTVEIPACSEDIERLKMAILEMEKIGVDYLNLHQLHFTEKNHLLLLEKGYTAINRPGHYPAIESELTALKILKFCVEENLSLPINYCSHIYKNRWQSRGFSIHRNHLKKEVLDSETECGHIRRIFIIGEVKKINTIISSFKQQNVDEKSWRLSPEGQVLHIDFTLLPLLLISCEIYVAYLATSILGRSIDNYKVNLNALAEPSLLPCSLLPKFHEVFILRKSNDVEKIEDFATYELIGDGLEEYK